MNLVEAVVNELISEAKGTPHDAAYTDRLLRHHGYVKSVFHKKTSATHTYLHPSGHKVDVDMSSGKWHHIPAHEEKSGQGNSALATHLTRLHNPNSKGY